ncbi:UNVERIFIED_CONTAM: hypothetical protein GTU68_026359 [Idotea baltica]|nr:hypothetical protein [Idotea baltica]
MVLVLPFLSVYY